MLARNSRRLVRFLGCSLKSCPALKKRGEKRTDGARGWQRNFWPGVVSPANREPRHCFFDVFAAWISRKGLKTPSSSPAVILNPRLSRNHIFFSGPFSQYLIVLNMVLVKMIVWNETLTWIELWMYLDSLVSAFWSDVWFDVWSDLIKTMIGRLDGSKMRTTYNLFVDLF